MTFIGHRKPFIQNRRLRHPPRVIACPSSWHNFADLVLDEVLYIVCWQFFLRFLKLVLQAQKLLILNKAHWLSQLRFHVSEQLLLNLTLRNLLLWTLFLIVPNRIHHLFDLKLDQLDLLLLLFDVFRSDFLHLFFWIRLIFFLKLFFCHRRLLLNILIKSLLTDHVGYDFLTSLLGLDIFFLRYSLF